jgi:hypothetical protein
MFLDELDARYYKIEVLRARLEKIFGANNYKIDVRGAVLRKSAHETYRR